MTPNDQDQMRLPLSSMGWEARGGPPARTPPSGAEAPRVRPGLGILVPAMLGAAMFAALAGTLARVAVHERSERTMLTRSVVGPDGGTVRFDDGGRVVFPRGALDEPRTITVWAHPDAVARRVTDEGDETAVGRVYEFGPLDIRFGSVVTVIFPAPVADRDVDVLVLTAEGVSRLPGRADLVAGTVTVRTSSFRFDDPTGDRR